jgi:hypothetical protein
MSNEPDTAKIIAGAIYCVVLIAGSYGYHNWQAARQAIAELSDDDRAKLAHIADLKAAVTSKRGATAVLSDDEAVLKSCLAAGNSNDRAAASCFWTEKTRIASAAKERQLSEFAAEKEKAAAQAAAATAAKLREQYNADRQGDQVRGTSVPTSAAIAMSPAQQPENQSSFRSGGRALEHLVSIPRARPSGPTVPSRMTRNGTFVPARQLDY